MNVNLLELGGEFLTDMNRKKNVWNRIKLINRSIEKGKIKLSKNTSINLPKNIDASTSGAIVGLLDGIISREEVSLEANPTDIMVYASGPMYITDKSSFDTEYTIVVPIAKKNAVDVFNYLDEGVIGDLLTTSTLGSVYKRIKSLWVKSNDPESPLTSVLYIPHICIFLDPYTGNLKKYYRKVNLLLVGIPSKKVIETSTEVVMNDEEYTARIIADMFDAAIKCGCKDLIINPFGFKLKNDIYTSAKLLTQISSSQKTYDHINKIIYSVVNDGEFIIMTNHLFKDVTK